MDHTTKPLTLQNETTYPAEFRLTLGGARLRPPTVMPGGSITVPAAQSLTVVATTTMDGNTYVSAPVVVPGASGFLAEMRQESAQGMYLFMLTPLPAWEPLTLTFESTCPWPVTFDIARGGVPMPPVVLQVPFSRKNVAIDETRSAYAIVNGVTTSEERSFDPTVTIVVVEGGNDWTFALEIR